MVQLPIFAAIVWTVSANNIFTTTDTTTKTISPLLRGHHHYSPRILVPHPNSGHQSTYTGCLGYSDSELSQSWSFSGQAPSCSWVHIDYYSGNDSDGSQSGGGSSGSSGSSSSNSGRSSGSSSSGGSSESSNSNGSSSNSNGSSSNGSSSGSNSNGSSSGGSGSGSSGNGGNEENGNSSGGGGYGDDDGNYVYNGDDGSYNEGGQSDGDDDYDGRTSENQADDDEIVVTNEDVYNGDSEYDPIDDFDIEACDTYDNLWLWDLSLSCDMTGGDLSLGGCNCTFAEELRDNGLLTCNDATLCPENCSICTTCMSLLGCDVAPPKQPLAIRLGSTSILLYIVAAAVALLIFALAVYYSRRKLQDERDLNKSLIEKQKHGNNIGDDQKGPSFMYIDGDLAWKPLPSDQQYAAQTIQPASTMSTASVSTGKAFLEERVQPRSGLYSGGDVSHDVAPVRQDVTFPTMIDTLDDIEKGFASPLQTSDDDSSADDDNNVFEDKPPSPINSENDQQKVENR
mmetsp:Transcript_20701/g.22162  ORF Transcript_20701/g.22162 Transcript_20701/m.22162 type:complete len:512 (+) Transcript_20701:456-1991(+)